MPQAFDRSSGVFGLTRQHIPDSGFKLRMLYIRKLLWIGAIFSSIVHYRQPSTFMYIGSTSQSVFRWESNRLSVAKKLSAGGEAQAELAIR